MTTASDPVDFTITIYVCTKNVRRAQVIFS